VSRERSDDACSKSSTAEDKTRSGPLYNVGAPRVKSRRWIFSKTRGFTLVLGGLAGRPFAAPRHHPLVDDVCRLSCVRATGAAITGPVRSEFVLNRLPDRRRRRRRPSQFLPVPVPIRSISDREYEQLA